MFVLEECLAYMANRNSKVLADALEKRMKPYGVTRVQWMALYYIDRADGIIQNELAELMGTKGPTIVRLIDRMYEDGLVLRIPDQQSRRNNIIVLTDKGKNLNRVLTGVAERFMHEGLAGLREEEMETFRHVLQTMVKNVGDIQS